MNQYLIPANSKKGQLLFNVFRPIDLAIVICGAFISLLLMFIIKSDAILMVAIKLLPIGVCCLLVMPVANYHNVLVFLQEVTAFYLNRRQFPWKGWCASYVDEGTK